MQGVHHQNHSENSSASFLPHKTLDLFFFNLSCNDIEINRVERNFLRNQLSELLFSCSQNVKLFSLRQFDGAFWCSAQAGRVFFLQISLREISLFQQSFQTAELLKRHLIALKLQKLQVDCRDTESSEGSAELMRLPQLGGGVPTIWGFVPKWEQTTRGFQARWNIFKFSLVSFLFLFFLHFTTHSVFSFLQDYVPSTVRQLG